MLFTCGEKHPEPDTDGLQAVAPMSGNSAWGTRGGISPGCRGGGDAALTPELMYSSSSRHSSEFCCCRRATSASRLALCMRISLGKKGRGLTQPVDASPSAVPPAMPPACPVPNSTGRHSLIFLQCHHQRIPQLQRWLGDNVCQGFPVLLVLGAVPYL